MAKHNDIQEINKFQNILIDYLKNSFIDKINIIQEKFVSIINSYEKISDNIFQDLIHMYKYTERILRNKKSDEYYLKEGECSIDNIKIL